MHVSRQDDTEPVIIVRSLVGRPLTRRPAPRPRFLPRCRHRPSKTASPPRLVDLIEIVIRNFVHVSHCVSVACPIVRSCCPQVTAAPVTNENTPIIVRLCVLFFFLYRSFERLRFVHNKLLSDLCLHRKKKTNKQNKKVLLFFDWLVRVVAGPLSSKKANKLKSNTTRTLPGDGRSTRNRNARCPINLEMKLFIKEIRE